MLFAIREYRMKEHAFKTSRDNGRSETLHL